MKKFRKADVDFMLMMFNQEIAHHIPDGNIILGRENVEVYSEGYRKGYTQAAMYLKEIFEGCLKEGRE